MAGGRRVRRGIAPLGSIAVLAIALAACSPAAPSAPATRTFDVQILASFHGGQSVPAVCSIPGCLLRIEYLDPAGVIVHASVAARLDTSTGALATDALTTTADQLTVRARLSGVSDVVYPSATPFVDTTFASCSTTLVSARDPLIVRVEITLESCRVDIGAPGAS